MSRKIIFLSLGLCFLLTSPNLVFACGCGYRGAAKIVVGNGDVIDGDTLNGVYDPRLDGGLITSTLAGIDIVGDAIVRNVTIIADGCGIHIWQGNPLVENCEIKNFGLMAIRIWNRPGNDPVNQITVPNKPWIMNNRILAGDNGYANTIALDDWSSAYIAGNVIKANPDNPTCINTGGLLYDQGSTVKPDLEIYNNTFYHNPYTDDASVVSFIELWKDVKIQIKNNIFINEASYGNPAEPAWISCIRNCRSGSCVPVEPLNNQARRQKNKRTCWNPWEGYCDFSDFVNYYSGIPNSQVDLHLVAGSGYIDAGVNVGLPYNGPAPDCGAYEY